MFIRFFSEKLEDFELFHYLIKHVTFIFYLTSENVFAAIQDCRFQISLKDGVDYWIDHRV